MITLHILIRVKPEAREELLEAARILFEELARQPTFIDASLGTSEEEPDLIVISERWNESRESFLRNILPNPCYQPYAAVLERVGASREVHWTTERHAWRPERR
jgi:quinol monooxygenase YgiN